MKNLGMAACAFALLSVGTAAAAESTPANGLKTGSYLGVDAGWIGYHDNIQGYSLDASSFAYGLFGGYQFNQYVCDGGLVHRHNQREHQHLRS